MCICLAQGFDVAVVFSLILACTRYAALTASAAVGLDVFFSHPPPSGLSALASAPNDAPDVLFAVFVIDLAD